MADLLCNDKPKNKPLKIPKINKFKKLLMKLIFIQ